jgi:hypothetical protein
MGVRMDCNIQELTWCWSGPEALAWTENVSGVGLGTLSIDEDLKYEVLRTCLATEVHGKVDAHFILLSSCRSIFLP